MKANELMIGDWVNILQNNVGIRKIDIGDLSFFTEFSPIPLTAEILEKNGWIIHPSGTITHYDHYDSNSNIAFDDGLVFKCFGLIKKIIYVHELQHALRLCGLEKLADNFKV